MSFSPGDQDYQPPVSQDEVDAGRVMVLATLIRLAGERGEVAAISKYAVQAEKYEATCTRIHAIQEDVMPKFARQVLLLLLGRAPRPDEITLVLGR